MSRFDKFVLQVFGNKRFGLVSHFQLNEAAPFKNSSTGSTVTKHSFFSVLERLHINIGKLLFLTFPFHLVAVHRKSVKTCDLRFNNYCF